MLAEAADLFTSVEVPVFPPKLKPPEGFAAGVAPNRLGVEDDVVAAGAAGFAPPNKEDVPPLAWVFCPNRLPPGGAPAGVVEGRSDVLFVAGVAVDVEPKRGVSRRVGGARCVWGLTTRVTKSK